LWSRLPCSLWPVLRSGPVKSGGQAELAEALSCSPALDLDVQTRCLDRLSLDPELGRSVVPGSQAGLGESGHLFQILLAELPRPGWLAVRARFLLAARLKTVTVICDRLGPGRGSGRAWLGLELLAGLAEIEIEIHRQGHDSSLCRSGPAVWPVPGLLTEPSLLIRRPGLIQT